MDNVLSIQNVPELQERLKEIVNVAIGKFNQKEAFLMENKLSERCICAKFASYIECVMHNNADVLKSHGIEVEEYHVDVEYNRYGYELKREPNEEKLITVDLIVHKRGENQYGSNLICIEMKKENLSCDKDEDRLKNLTDENLRYRYLAGYMILIKIKNEYCLCIDSEYLQRINDV